jgi:hypothetical protein
MFERLVVGAAVAGLLVSFHGRRKLSLIVSHVKLCIFRKE